MEKDIIERIRQQQAFFSTQQTQSLTFRKAALRQLAVAIAEQENAICDAVYADFKKPRFETLLSETQIVLAEINLCLSRLHRWARPEKVRSSLANFPSSDCIFKEPYGRVLILAPWNYPFMLALMPLVGAIAAGNTVVLKPSEKSAHTSAVIHKILSSVFAGEHVVVFQGGVSLSQLLLRQKWDYIFFTGSTVVGKIVYENAARHLTPVTLELGGKNPCIVDGTAAIDLAAKRIVWGKFFNAGQTCVAPDYILVHQSKKEALITAMVKYITQFYGADIRQSPHFARIIDGANHKSLKELLKGENILFGGEFDDSELYLSPTLIDGPTPTGALMEREIFGPILPIIAFDNENDIQAHINRYHKPLATYIFSTDKAFQARILKKYSFGGGVINDTLLHLANHRLPFGGVGQSGMGTYHGKTSFDLFSHRKSISKKGNWLDVPLRYAPYKTTLSYLKWLKHLL